MAVLILDTIVIDDNKNIDNIENVNTVGIVTATKFDGSYEGNFALDTYLFG